MRKLGQESRSYGENFRLSNKSEVYQRLHTMRSYHYYLLRLDDSSAGPDISDVLQSRPEAILNVALREQDREAYYDELLSNAPWRRSSDGFIGRQLENEIRWRVACAKKSDGPTDSIR
ncbi:MAG: hypothetical protein K2W95_35440 [Candidatus Obscuribacterales bacterium]|nr:hypothetical protein [Candidatus Obscuribacterales bacterium]